MAPLPKRRHSTRRGGKRKASIAQRLTDLIACAQCGSVRRSHRICPSCGYYDGKLLKAKRTKPIKKAK